MNSYSFFLYRGGIGMLKSYINNIENWKENFTFYVPIEVRFSETDLYGHMNNTVPFVYFEQARIDYLKSLGLMQEWLNNGETIPVVADLQCDFVKQVFFGEQLKVYAKIADMGASSMDIHYLAVNEKDEICFGGRGAMVQISAKTGKSVRWQEEQLAKLTR